MSAKTKPRGPRSHLPVCSVANGIQRISSAQLETLLHGKGIELGDRRLRQLAKEGFFPEPDRGEYEFLATLLGLVKYFRELYARKADGIVEEEKRIAIAKRKIIEVEASRMQDEVEEIAEVERSRIAMVMLIRQKLLALPSQAASYLACCDTQQQIETELERQIEKILGDLETPAFIAREENGGASVPASHPTGTGPQSEDGAGKQSRA